MSIWIIRVDVGKYRGLNLIDRSETIPLGKSIGRAEKVSHIWKRPQVEYETEIYQGMEVQPVSGLSNFILGELGIVWDKKAMDVLSPLVSESIEALPIICGDEEFYLINVIKVLNCLDHSKSEFTRFSTGNIKRIDRYIFKEDCLENQHIFRLSETNYSKTYVSDAFKSIVEENQLVGLIFNEIPYK